MDKFELKKLSIIKNLPENIAQALEHVNIDKIDEIRIRVNNPIIVKMGQNEIILKYIINQEEIINILQNFCSNSIYTYQNQICGGYITIPGGHRVGISGSAVIKEGKVTNITNLYSLNIRVAKEIKNCSIPLLQYIINIRRKFYI